MSAREAAPPSTRRPSVHPCATVSDLCLSWCEYEDSEAKESACVSSMGAELSSPTEAAAASAGRLPEAPQADAARTIQALWRSYLLRMDALDTVEELRQRRACRPAAVRSWCS